MHGRYSKRVRQELATLIIEYQNDPNPLSLEAEVAALRALAADYLTRTEAQPLVASELIGRVVAAVEKIERIGAANAISRTELLRIMSAMGREANRVIVTAVADEELRNRLMSSLATAWGSIAL